MNNGYYYEMQGRRLRPVYSCFIQAHITLPDKYYNNQMAEFVEGDWKNFTFKMAQPENYSKIFEHLEENFYLDEAFNKHLGQSKERIADMNLLGLDYLKQNLSFFVYDRENNDKIVGVRVTGITRKGDSTNKLIPYLQSEISREIFPIVEKFEEEADIYGKFGIDHYGDFLYLSVDRNYRRCGLANEMYDRAIKMLKAIGIPAALSIFSNPISQGIARKLGFVELGRKYLKDYVNSDGSIFFSEVGDEEVQIIMAKMIY